MNVGLVAACTDRRLLGLSPHPRQRELLEAVERSRLTVAACGRRFGKTRAAAAAALHNLLLIPELDGMVSAGETRYAVSVANSQAQARLFVEHARSLVSASPMLEQLLEGETTNELVFRGRRRLAAFPCSSSATRGFPISFLCLDELAHFFDIEEGGPQVATRVWSAMTPSVAQFGALGRVVVISTPLGSSGLFAELYAKARNGELEEAEAFHAPTSSNPLIDASYLAQQEATLGADDYAREFGAEFLSGGASFIEASRIQDVIVDRQEAMPAEGTAWTAALDPSFSRDATALAIVGRSISDREQLVLGYAGRWLPPRPRKRMRFSREQQADITDEILDEVAAVLRRFRLTSVVSDQHSPGVVTHELGKRGIRVVVHAWTASSRTEALQALRSRIYSRRIALYDPLGVPLITELQRLRTKYRAGASQVEVPRVGDSHGDVALAVAAAVYEHDRHGISLGPARTSVARGRLPVGAPRRALSLDDLSLQLTGRRMEPAPSSTHSRKGRT